MKWPADKAACYGVCCHLHGTCERYAAVDHNDNQQQVFVDHCGPQYSLYVAVIPVMRAPVELASAAEAA